MGLIDKILGRDKEKEEVIKAGQTFKIVSGYDPVFHDWRGELYESMLVRAAIDARARHISKLKVEFMGTAKPDLTARLAKRPNPWDTWSQFLYRVSTILDCCNNCLLVPIYDSELTKIGFFPVLPSKCKIVTYKNEPWIIYEFMNGRQKAACKWSEAALLRKFQFKNDFFGSTNTVLDSTMDLIDTQRQSIKEAIKSTASYKFMAKLTNFSKMGDLEKERENFSEAAFGKEVKKSGLLLFPNTYNDIKQIDIKPWTPDKDQMDYINKNVYDYFGVNEDILQNKAIGDAWSAFYEGCVEVFSIQFSETLTFALYSEREISFGAKVMATANRLQYMSNQDKLSISEKMADRGLMTINEIRDIWNLAPTEWGDIPIRRGEYKDFTEVDTEKISENVAENEDLFNNNGGAEND